MAFRIQQSVRHPDVDRAGIVYFPRFYDFFHRALEDFFAQEARTPVWDLPETMGVAFPVVRIETDFERPLAHGDVVDVTIETLALGRTSLTVASDVIRVGASEPSARSRIVLCCLQLPGWQPAEPPAVVRAAFERHLRR
jgi:4-hydroxybenzoyl-CoA thioesterase